MMTITQHALQGPKGLRLGISTASTAIDGRPPDPARPSIWDVFAAAPGRIADGTSPQDGPGHRRHWRDDIRLLADLGVDCYRFSLPWSALHEPGPAVLAEWRHIEEFADGLVSVGIEPIVTLSHYDMPVSVMSEGGWLERETAQIFAAFAQQAVARLGDRVSAWVTLNSPLVHTAYGYGLGIEAPGLTMLGGCLVAAVHQLLGHGMAVEALRAGGARLVGIANAHAPVAAADPYDEADGAAADLVDALVNRAFTEPLLGLPWPAELAVLGPLPSQPLDLSDLSAVSAPLDFYGVNYYHPLRVQAAPDNLRVPFELVEPRAGDPVDAFGWPLAPDGLRHILLDLHRRFPSLPPLWVTENGTQDAGGTDDHARVDFLNHHVDAVQAARQEGVDVQAYLHWSLLDGWEFGEGLSHRFGLVGVDTVTGARTPKRSFAAYQQLLTAAKRDRG